MRKTTQWLTRTAILLALTLLFQSIRVLLPKITIPVMGDVDQYIIGTLVNTCLIIAAVIVGAKGGIIISILAPVVAFLQGELAFPVLIPFIVLGNVTIVLIVSLFFKKNKYVALFGGAIGKFIFLYFTIVNIALPMIIPNLQGPQVNMVPKLLSFKFSWPQLVTAIIGSILSLIILPLINKSNFEK